MKIVTLYNPIIDRGGISVSYINIANTLSKKYPNQVFHLLVNQKEIPKIEDNKNIKIINIKNFSRIPFEKILNWGKYLSSVKSILGILIYLIKYNPDYFVSFQGHFIVVICKIITNKKTVFISRENTVIGENFKFFNQSLYRYRIGIKKFTYKNSDKVVTLTDEATKYSAKLLNLPKNKFIGIGNISAEDDDVQEEFTIKTNPNIICVSRISREKGIDLIIKSFALVPENLNARLIIVGNGSYLKEAKELAKKLEVFEKCIFEGWIGDSKKISQLISTSDIFLSASLFEGFGNSIIEAIKCKTLVISTDVPFGPREILEKGKNGILIKNDHNLRFEMAKKIEFAINNPDISKKYTDRAYKSLSRYNAEIIGEKWGKILNLNN